MVYFRIHIVINYKKIHIIKQCLEYLNHYKRNAKYAFYFMMILHTHKTFKLINFNEYDDNSIQNIAACK